MNEVLFNYSSRNIRLLFLSFIINFQFQESSSTKRSILTVMIFPDDDHWVEEITTAPTTLKTINVPNETTTEWRIIFREDS